MYRAQVRVCSSSRRRASPHHARRSARAVAPPSCAARLRGKLYQQNRGENTQFAAHAHSTAGENDMRAVMIEFGHIGRIYFEARRAAGCAEDLAQQVQKKGTKKKKMSRQEKCCREAAAAARARSPSRCAALLRQSTLRSLRHVGLRLERIFCMLSRRTHCQPAAHAPCCAPSATACRHCNYVMTAHWQRVPEGSQEACGCH